MCAGVQAPGRQSLWAPRPLGAGGLSAKYSLAACTKYPCAGCAKLLCAACAKYPIGGVR